MYRSLALIFALVFAAPAVAQTQKALEVVPEDALGFILVKDLKQFSNQVDELAKKVKAPAHVSLLELIQKQMGIQKGLNEKGSAILIILKPKNEKSMPGFVAALAISDYKALSEELGAKNSKDNISEGSIGAPSSLLAGLGEKDDVKLAPKIPVLLAQKGDFALITAPDQREALQQVLSASKSLASKLKPAQAWLDEQDISGVCTDTGIKMGLGMGLMTPGGGVESSTPGQFDKMKSTFAEVERNVKLIAFGARLEKEGHSRLVTRVYFDPAGPYAKWMAKAAPIDGNLLSAFPDEAYLYAAMAHISPQMNFEGFVANLLPAKLPAEKAKELSTATGKLLQRISEAGMTFYHPANWGSGSYSAVLPRIGIIVTVQNLTGAFKVDDAPAFVKDATALLKKGFAEAKSAGTALGDVKFQQLQIAGKPTQLIIVPEQKSDKKADAPAKESPPVALTLTVIDQHTVLVGLLQDAGQAEAFVKRFAQLPAHSLDTNIQLKKTASLLPEKLQLVTYLNLQSLTSSGLGAFQLPACPPVAFALRAVPDGIEAQFVIPVETLAAVFEGLNSQKKAGGK